MAKQGEPGGAGELFRMRSRLHASVADQAEPEACGPMAVKPLRGMHADGGGAVEVRKQEGLAEGTSEEDGRHGLRGCSEVGAFGGRRGELVR